MTFSGPVRLLDPTEWNASSKRKSPRYCEAEGCKQPTNRGKPYCTDHVQNSPYVQVVLSDLETRDAEIEGAQGRYGSVPDNGFLVTDFLIVLQYTCDGYASIPRLGRELNIDPKTVLKVAKKLARQGAVKLGKTDRGKNSVYALPPLRAVAC